MIGSLLFLLFYSLCNQSLISSVLFPICIVMYLWNNLMIFSLLQNLGHENGEIGGFTWASLCNRSEFIKPFLIVILAYFISSKDKIKLYSYALDGKIVAFAILTFTSLILIKQPNYSMVAIFFCSFIPIFYSRSMWM